MRYQNKDLREKLAAEFVLGTLHGGARNHFKSLMKYDGDLRRIVASWESHLSGFNQAVPEIQPSIKVWQGILTKINKSPLEKPALIQRLVAWSVFTSIASVASLALGIYLATSLPPEPPMSMLAVLQDRMANPSMMISWPKTITAKSKVKVQVIMPDTKLAKGQSLEMWAVPADKSSPVSLGLISQDSEQMIEVSDKAAQVLRNASAIAISVEPAGGSPSGYPTGPVLYQGASIPLS